MTSVFSFFAKPFVNYSQADNTSFVAVRGRLPSPKCDTKNAMTSIPESAQGTCDLEDLSACQAFDLKASLNLSVEGAHAIRALSREDPACLVGFQICLLLDNPVETIDPDASIAPDSENVRIVCAYSKEVVDLSLFKRSRYLLMKQDGESEWTELQRGPKKRGKKFTPLRRVC